MKTESEILAEENGLIITGESNVIHILQEPLDRLSQADPANVQQIAASQIELLSVYHTLVLDQARRSFRWALIAASVGLGFFLAAIAFLLLQQSQGIATVSLVSGSLVEVISAINFYLYGRTSSQLAEFQSRLDATQRFLLANSVCEGLTGDYKQRSRAELVRAIAGINLDKETTPVQGTDH